MTIPAILAESVTVKFRPYVDRKPTMRRSLSRLRHRDVTEVTAVEDVSLEILPGRAYGVIGRNGAGKSTLLRCLAGTLRPNDGRVVINGRVSTLLQLGVGFNPELSGRANVYLGALAAGMSKAAVEDRFDEIVDYADLRNAIDRPMKTYSSGMFSRLAFSVGIHQDPDILFLDEVLAVGDEAFRKKSMRSMQTLLEDSSSIVMVSHSLSSIRSFCDDVVWLDSGRVRMSGDPDEVTYAYRAAIDVSDKQEEKQEKVSRRPGKNPPVWPIARKTEVVLRLLAGEEVDVVAKEVKVPPDKLMDWRDSFLAAGRHGLKVAPKSDN